ncbi:MAG TPA: hypothetical protein VIJ20_03295 [Solirubrobacteraceae bacterium]
MLSSRTGSLSLRTLLAAALTVLVAAAAGVGVALAAGSLTASAANTTFEVRLQTLRTGAYRDAGDYATQFGPVEVGQGTWQAFDSSSGVPELGFIQDVGTPSGTVAVHLDAFVDGAYKDIGDYPSRFTTAQAADGTLQLFGTAGGAPELGLIKLRSTTAKTVHVDLEALTKGVYKDVGEYTSDFPVADGADGTWQLVAGSGAPELAFIATSTGAVEVHLDAVSGTTYKRVANYPVKLSSPGAGVWELFGSSAAAPELGYVELKPGPIQVRWATLRSGIYKLAGSSPSVFSAGLAYDGIWQLFGPGPAPVLALVKTPAPPPPTTTETVPVTVTTVVTEPLPTPPPPKPHARGHVRARLAISYRFDFARTRILGVRVSHFPRRGRIEVRCYGRSCPRLAVAAGYRRLGGALRSLHGRMLGAGDLLKITVTAPGLLPEEIGVRIRDGEKPRARLL